MKHRSSDSPPAPVLAAWCGVVRAWNERARHDAFLGVVAQHGCFAWATARYREQPIDWIACQQLERLRRAAVAVMLATATVRKEPRPGLYRWALITCVCVAFFTLCGRVFGTAVSAHAEYVTRQAPAAAAAAAPAQPADLR